ncbi:DUF1014-domain-containing protein [Microthyrium microscopicum]|uniref:DUF1014-domain-containing protein n=1 Tax=Microthyrium microscopicum TaxID=703497 RepID=A0A6A6UTX0_9PEZI|nr:DUF1014-domain-containing protein [Microthyrium microscopicum]
MAGKRGAGENSKKVAGQARKADAAAAKKGAAQEREAAAESATWKDGAKDSSKKEAAAAKAQEAARKKAERAALEAEEMSSLKTAKTGNAKTAAPKKSRGLDLAQLDSADDTKTSSLNATGIDNALDALALTSNTNEEVDRHPERRFKAAYNAFEERRLEEMKDDKSLRRQQKIVLIRKEFEKHPDNPFNQTSANYNATRAERQQITAEAKKKIESHLGVST